MGCSWLSHRWETSLHRRLLEFLVVLGVFGHLGRSQASDSNPTVSKNLADGNPNAIAANAPRQDCQFSDWSSWSNCLGQGTFGVPTGIHMRSRKVRSPEMGATGKPCTSPMNDAELCLTSTGVVDSSSPNSRLTGAVGTGADHIDATTLTPCTLSEWGMWSGCMSEPDPSNSGTQSCGYSFETRLRPPLNPPCLITDEVRSSLLDCSLDDVGDVAGCDSQTSDRGSLLESRLCPIGICNADCLVSSWSVYTDCSETCGTGVQRRKRGVTQSPGGTGLSCPHLVESKNCRVQDCDIDCQVGDFSPWGRCLPVAPTSSQAVVPTSSGKSSNSSCTRQRSRPVLTQRASTGAPCQKLQEFQNCPCPFGTDIAVSVKNATLALSYASKMFGGNVSDSARQAFSGVRNKLKQVGVDLRIMAACSALACLLACCLCGSCIWLLAKKRKPRKVVSYDDRGGASFGEYAKGSRGLDANEEDDSNDRTSLLSERPPPMAHSQATPAWRETAELGTMMYGNMPNSGMGYPSSSMGYADSPLGPAGPGPYGQVWPGAPTGGGYLGRYVDTAPYGGLLEPPGISQGYNEPSLYDYAPRPLHPPPPQYYERSQAYGRGPPTMPPC